MSKDEIEYQNAAVIANIATIAYDVMERIGGNEVPSVAPDEMKSRIAAAINVRINAGVAA